MSKEKEIKEEVKKEEPELTEKQKQALKWMQYVSDEVNALLGIFLPISQSGTVGVKYNKHIKAMYESGPEYDEKKADGVEIRLVFDFEKAVDIPKAPAE
jgi:hypothetical protein